VYLERARRNSHKTGPSDAAHRRTPNMTGDGLRMTYACVAGRQALAVMVTASARIL
jgi:hypothetical protein